jgi:hypothetical protein
VDSFADLPAVVAEVVSDLIARYRRADHTSAVTAVAGRRETAIPAIRLAVADAGVPGGSADLGARALTQFDQALGFRTRKVQARASANPGTVTAVRDDVS